jgi:hypothetical protein
MEIKLNIEAKEQRINQYYNGAIEKITTYANDGFDLSEHIFPNDIYKEVRIKIKEHMEAFNIGFVWVSIGGMNSISVGEGRLMRFKLLNK